MSRKLSINGRIYEATTSHKVSINGAVYEETVSLAPIASGTFDPPDGNVSSAYSYATSTLFTGGAPTSYSMNGTLPPGLTLNTSTGLISGTPTTTGTYSTLSVTGTNADGSDTTNTADIAIAAALNPPVASGTFNPPNGNVSSAYSYDASVLFTGGTPTSYAMIGTLPAGLTLNTSTGLISGTPTTEGTTTGLDITGTNGDGSDSTADSADIVISAAVESSGKPSLSLSFGLMGGIGGTVGLLAPVASGTFAPPSGIVGVVYSYNTALLFTGGTPASYSLTGTLPAGLSFSTTTGVISGTPTTEETATNLSVTATNATGNDTTNTASIAISAAVTATEVTIRNITWTFDGSVTVGQFATGDYYVVDPGSGVTVLSVSPAPVSGRNGTMINPVPGAGQGLDINGDDYEPTMHETFPLSVSSGDAIVSSIAKTTQTTDWQGLTIGSNTDVAEAEILTILSAAPAPGTFRPCPSDRSQNLYNTSQIDLSIMPEKSLIGITIPTHSGFATQLEYLERGIERPWILFGNDWQARAIHASENMSWYHEYIGEYLSELCVFLCSDAAGKTTLINRFIQLGIDYRYSGNSDSCVWSFPVVFAGLLIDESSLYNYWVNNPTVRNQRDHEKLYYIGDRTTSTSSIIATGETFVDWQAPGGEYVAFAKQTGEEYEHLHPSEWTCYTPHCKGEVYRAQHDVHPLVGMTLSSILVDAKIGAGTDVNAMLAHDPIKDYVDRWMDNPWENETYVPSGRTYKAEMEYYQTFTIYYENYGTSTSTFIDDMWATYR